MLSNKNKLLAFGSLFLASVIWGATGSIMKITLLSVPVFSLALIRFGVASLILFPFVRRSLHIQKKDFFTLFIASFLGIFIHITTFLVGIELTTALNAGIIASTAPLLTLYLAHLFLKERIQPRYIVGSLIGLAGIVVIFAKDFQIQAISLSPLGNILILISTLAFVVYEISSKKLFVRYNPLTVTFYSFAIGSLFFMPFAGFEYLRNPSWISTLPLAAIGGIFYGIFFSSVGAYLLWQWGLSKVDVARGGFFVYLDPVVSTVAGVLLLHEQLTLPFMLGGLLIFSGLFIAEKRFHFLPLHILFTKEK